MSLTPSNPTADWADLREIPGADSRARWSRVKGGDIVVHDLALRAYHRAHVSSTFMPLVRERGGFVYTVTYRHWATSLLADPAALEAYTDDPAAGYHTWVRADSIEPIPV